MTKDVCLPRLAPKHARLKIDVGEPRVHEEILVLLELPQDGIGSVLEGSAHCAGDKTASPRRKTWPDNCPCPHSYMDACELVAQQTYPTIICPLWLWCWRSPLQLSTWNGLPCAHVNVPHGGSIEDENQLVKFE